jgi:protein involved in polysaccharide export with SLBB domain
VKLEDNKGGEMKSLKMHVFFLLAMAVCFSAWAEDVNKAPAAATSVATALSQRKIRSGDRINITVWQHKDLSTAVVVDEAGNLEYLFLGVMHVEGKTIAELKDILKKGISDNYIVDPKIDITLDRKSLTFFVTGEIRKPGTYEFVPGLTVLEAVAMAGDFTDYASRKVKIIRKDESGKEKEIKVNVSKLLRATEKRKESQLQVDDILVAERAWW